MIFATDRGRSTVLPLALGASPDRAPSLLCSDTTRDPVSGGLRGAALLAAVERAGLRGRGGAAFPAAVKLRAVAERPGPRVVVANGEEGEPASVKDRWLMRTRPRLVLDGLVRASEIVGAQEAWVYVADVPSAEALGVALTDLGRTAVSLRMFVVDPAYVAGEETAVVRALDGGPALPLDKPPRPFESGVGGRPTLVSNVETLAVLSLLAGRAGNTTDWATSDPTPFDPEPADPAAAFLMTVTGAVDRPGLYEVPYGGTLGGVLDAVAAPRPHPRGYLMGGFFGGVLGPGARHLPLDPDVLRARGTGMGSGAVVVLAEDDCPVSAAADVMAFLARENANQCGACIRGTPAMAEVLADLGAGRATPEQIERLTRWSTSLRGRGACGALDGATVLAGSLLAEFSDDVTAHLTSACPTCAALPPGVRTRFAVPDAVFPPTTTGGSS